MAGSRWWHEAQVEVEIRCTQALWLWGFCRLEHGLRVDVERFRALRARTALSLMLTGVVATGCGTPSPDLFVVERDGTVAGAQLTLLVSDQTARCNDRPARDLTSAQIIEARDLKRELLLLQTGEEAVPPAPPAQIFEFAVQTEEGTLRYPDTQQRPELLPRLSRFVRRVAIDTCGLKR